MFSGFAGYGKYDEIIKFDPELRPKTLLIAVGETIDHVIKQIETEHIWYPMIIKPNLGRMARDIYKIENEHQLREKLSSIQENYVIQEFIDYPLEFWILYYRIPWEEKWHITGITDKRLLFVKGNGKHTLGELIENHDRAKYYYTYFKQLHHKIWDHIIPVEETFQLHFLGNHCRWSCFYDVTNLITDKLETIIDSITKTIPEFYFGRYDLKAKSLEDLYAGKFKIIELNGMGTLPVHIYDPNHNLRYAYKEIFRHRNIIYKISKKNYERWYNFLTLKEAKKIIKQYGI